MHYESERVVGLPESQTASDYATYEQSFAKTYKLLCDGKPIPVTPEGVQMHEALGPPQLVLLDVSQYHCISSIY